MADVPPNITKEFVSIEIFEKELCKTYNNLILQRQLWTKQKICQVLDFIEERQLKLTKRQTNQVLKDIIDDRMPEHLQEAPIQFYCIPDDNATPRTQINIQNNKHYYNQPKLSFGSEKYYNFLIEIHLSTNHGKVKDMVACMKKRECFIPMPSIITFIKLCKICQNKELEKKAAFVPPKLLPKSAVVNLIDLQAMPAGNHKWVLHYCDLNMKSSMLHPLTSNSVEEVTCGIVKCVMKTGCPTVLHSDGSDLITEVHKKLLHMWPNRKYIELQPCDQSAMDKICEDIKKLIMDWLVENDWVSWSVGVYFLQYKVRCTFDKTMIKVTPQTPIEEQLLPLKKESTNSGIETKKDKGIPLNERDELKTENKININENCEKDITLNENDVFQTEDKTNINEHCGTDIPLNESDELETENKTNINENCEKVITLNDSDGFKTEKEINMKENILTNALEDQIIALSE